MSNYIQELYKSNKKLNETVLKNQTKNNENFNKLFDAIINLNLKMDRIIEQNEIIMNSFQLNTNENGFNEFDSKQNEITYNLKKMEQMLEN